MTAKVLAVILAGTLLASCSATSERESPREYAADSLITGKVKTALVLEDISTLLSVEVETFRGVVLLSGFVNNEREREVAGKAAAEVAGIVRVENALIVKPGS